MSKKRYTAEFRAEAVRQVTERGYPALEVAGRLGVSTHSPDNRVDDRMESRLARRKGRRIG